MSDLKSTSSGKRRRASSAPQAFRLPDPDAEAALAVRMGVSFADPWLIRLALTHRSALHDWATVRDLDAIRQSNERLEFLGDALLGAFVAEYLYLRDPGADEGQLTRSRVALVRAETLVAWARELGVQDCLYLGIGERVSEAARDRMLAGAFEALVGAVDLDQGRDAAERLVLDFLTRDSESIRASEHDANPKGLLQEMLQDQALPAPSYVSLAREGPDHARHFTEAVIVEGEQLGIGIGPSRRTAQQAAARLAIEELERRASSP